MARNRSFRDLLTARLALLLILLAPGLSGTPAGGQEKEKERLPFRLSGADRAGKESKTPAIEVSSNETADDEGEASNEVSQPSEREEGSGVITGEVRESKKSAEPEEREDPEEPGESKTSRGYYRMQNLFPAPRVQAPGPKGTAGEVEVSARANFRMSARKPEASRFKLSAGSEVGEAAAKTRALMGPPDPSLIGLEIDGRVPPDPAHSVAGARSLGRAISAHKRGEGLPLPGQDPDLPAGEGLPGAVESDETLFANWLPGQQGTPYSAADAAEPVPGASTRVETFASDGYFPTQDDYTYIGDLDYPRGRVVSGGGGGPGTAAGIGAGPATYRGEDFRSLGFTGIFPYENPDETFYDRHGYVFGPLDRGLGFFAPHDALVIENQRLQNFSASLDGQMPIFTNRFNPDRAHFKAGPFYLDILSVGAGVLYSDFTPGKNYPGFGEDEEDGWLGYIDLDVRALLQVTNNFYLSAATRVMYLPSQNRVAFQLGYGTQPFAQFRLNYEDTWGMWDVNFYNEFRGHLGVDIWSEVRSPAIDRAGRYYFGIYDLNRTNRFFDEGAVVFMNALGANASRALGEDWRLWLRADHRDFWRGWDFVDHSRRDHAGATVGYEGSRVPFSPYVSYDTYTIDSFDSFFHTAMVGGHGRLTENLSLNARGGYLWSSSRDPDYDSWLWRLGLNHDLSRNTRHGVAGGQGFFANDLYSDTVVADYVSYYFNHQFSRTLYGRVYAQWSDEDVLSSDGRTDGEERERDMYGAYLNFRPLEYTGVRAGAYYQKTETDGGGFEDDRWVYYGMVSQRVFSRLSIWFRYQFEDSDYFDEHLYVTGVRRYF